jgi:pimeloyl-ACP methyl ester carboxylesterase
MKEGEEKIKVTMADSPINRLSEPAEQPPIIEQPIQAVVSSSVAAQQAENALKDIYFISGLGADERVFRLLKFEGYRPVHIHWLDPKRGETIADYAQRLTAQINSDCPIIIGLSFGGMIAVEIAKQISVDKVILISSVKTESEIPFYFRLFRWLPIHRVIPFKSLLWIGYWFAFWIFSLEMPDERQLLKAILLDTDAHFIKWAIHKVVTWKNETIPDHVYHIHGTSDRIFPLRFIDADFLIEKGGHFMVMNRAAQVSKLIEKIMS